MKMLVHMKKKITEQNGFTLIEMVIALFIVSVVMAIALPNLQTAGANAAQTGCEGNQKMIRAALTEYYLTNHQYPPETDTAGILNDLKTNGYIDSVPTCPSGGDYTITITPTSTSTAGTNTNGTTTTSTSTGTTTNSTMEVKVSCTAHGELGD